jgi:broad specificity phosphatase PhoE
VNALLLNALLLHCTHQFPKGESYADLFRRLEPVLLELLGEKTRVIICAHLPVLRICYSYLMDISPDECCTLDIPLNCAINLTPRGYGYSETRYYPLR